MEKIRVSQIEVYTDGSFTPPNKCGYGIYYGNILPSISRKFKGTEPSNNRAELQAIYVALIQIIKKVKTNKVIIYSDSNYCIQSITKWAKVWEKNKWKTAQNQDVKNQDIIKPIYNIYIKNKDKIEFIHIGAHTGKQDKHSLSNEIADKLAKEGACKK